MSEMMLSSTGHGGDIDLSVSPLKTDQSPGIVLILVVLLSLPFASMAANAAGPDVIATWRGGIHSLPASVTLSGNGEDISLMDEPPEQWERRLRWDLVKPGAKVPAVIYLHGCSGPLDAASWGQLFNKFDFAFFAPNAFARPGRQVECFADNWDSRMSDRMAEMQYTLSKVREFEWIDQSRLILAGFSSGGATVSEWSGSEFIAHVILGFDCSSGYPQAPSSIPVLNIVGAADRYGYGNGCAESGPEAKGAKTVSLPGQGHSFAGAHEADAAIAKFLKACCGYRPESTMANRDPEATARKLIEELGGIATMDAMIKADEALANGDEKGNAFWKRVHDIAMKLSGG